MKATYVFIDGSNFYHACKAALNSTRVDFHKLSLRLCQEIGADYQLSRVYYYNVPVDQTTQFENYRNQQKFFDQLRQTPFLSVHLGRLEKRGGSYVEKGVDVQIAVDMLTMAAGKQYDAAILISGDADFVPVLKSIKDKFSQHVFVAYPNTTCFHLKSEADRFILITKEMFDQCQ